MKKISPKFYENLAIAICARAAVDYQAAYRKWYEGINNPKALSEEVSGYKAQFEEIEQEILDGDIWELTTDVAWEYVKQHLEREVEEQWHSRSNVRKRFSTLAVS